MDKLLTSEMLSKTIQKHNQTLVEKRDARLAAGWDTPGSGHTGRWGDLSGFGALGGGLQEGGSGREDSLAAARRTAMLRGLLLLLRETAAERTAAIAERTAAERNCART